MSRPSRFAFRVTAEPYHVDAGNEYFLHVYLIMPGEPKRDDGKGDEDRMAHDICGHERQVDVPSIGRVALVAMAHITMLEQQRGIPSA